MVQETTLDTPGGIYSKVVNSGIRKSQLVWHKMMLSGFNAGIMVGLAGHVAAKAGAGAEWMGEGPQMMLYMSLFPFALIGIIWLGAELYTGNTMAMLCALLHCRVKWYHLIINWLSSMSMNTIGALFVAYLLSYLTGSFSSEPQLSYVISNAEGKVKYEIYQVFLKALGCNLFVCYSILITYGSMDTAGKVLVIYLWIVAFGVAGFEHIIANVYTIPMGMFYGADISIGKLIGTNLVWTFLGNTISGCVLVGVPQWWLHKEYYEENFPPTELETIRKLSIRDDGSDTNPHTPMYLQQRISLAEKGSIKGSRIDFGSDKNSDVMV